MFLEIKLGNKIQKPNREIENFSQLDASLIFPSLGINGQILYDYNLEKIRDLKEVLAFKIFSKVGRPLSVFPAGTEIAGIPR